MCRKGIILIYVLFVFTVMFMNMSSQNMRMIFKLNTLKYMINKNIVNLRKCITIILMSVR